MFHIHALRNIYTHICSKPTIWAIVIFYRYSCQAPDGGHKSSWNM